MQSVVHPGAVRQSRMDLAACAGREIEVTLAADIPLEDAVAQALAPLGLDSAWLEIENAPVTTMRYVIPAQAPDNSHVAWYSAPRGFEEGQLDHLGMIVGRHGGASFLHGHGTWTPKGGAQAMGHILAPQTQLATPAKARGVGLNGAQFDRRADAETNFELFQVDQLARTDDDAFAALRLLPNQDFATALDGACATLGWSAAKVQGIGSVHTPKFEDGRVLNSMPTEFLVLDATAGRGGQGPEIIVVGTDGEDILSGRLSRGENAILVTAELVLSRMTVDR